MNYTYYTQPHYQHQNRYNFYYGFRNYNFQNLHQNNYNHSQHSHSCCHNHTHNNFQRTCAQTTEPPLIAKIFSKFFGKHLNKKNIDSKKSQIQETPSSKHHSHQNNAIINSNVSNPVLFINSSSSDCYNYSLNESIYNKNEYNSKNFPIEESQFKNRPQKNVRLSKYKSLNDSERLDNLVLNNHKNILQKSTSNSDFYNRYLTEEKRYEESEPKNTPRTVKRVRFDKYYTVIEKHDRDDFYNDDQNHLNAKRRSNSYSALDKYKDLNSFEINQINKQKKSHLDNYILHENRNECFEKSKYYEHENERILLPQMLNETNNKSKNKKFINDLKESFRLFKLSLKKNLAKRLE